MNSDNEEILESDMFNNEAKKKETLKVFIADDFVEEIKTMTEVYTDEKILMKVKENKILDRYKIKVVKERKK